MAGVRWFPVALLVLLCSSHYTLSTLVFGPQDPPNLPDRSLPGQPPFIDALPVEISLQNIIPPPFHPRVTRQDWTSFVPFFNPNFFSNVFEARNQVQIGVFNTIIEQFKSNMEIIYHRQNTLMKYVECACPNTAKCKQGDKENDDVSSFKGINWNWGSFIPSGIPGFSHSQFSKPNANIVTVDYFLGVMTTFKNAVEKLTLRQNLMYEYVVCSCTATTECSGSIKPILEVMFNSNTNITAEILQNLFYPPQSSKPSENKPSGFLASLGNLFKPSQFSGDMFGGYFFNPLSSLLGSDLSHKPGTQGKPQSTGSFWSTAFGNKPGSSIHYGGSLGGGIVSTGSGGEGIQVSSPGGVGGSGVHISGHPEGGQFVYSSSTSRPGESGGVLVTSTGDGQVHISSLGGSEAIHGAVGELGGAAANLTAAGAGAANALVDAGANIANHAASSASEAIQNVVGALEGTNAGISAGIAVAHEAAHQFIGNAVSSAEHHLPHVEVGFSADIDKPHGHHDH